MLKSVNIQYEFGRKLKELRSRSISSSYLKTLKDFSDVVALYRYIEYDIFTMNLMRYGNITAQLPVALVLLSQPIFEILYA